MKVTISLTNAKLGGAIPCINLPVDTSCRKDAPCQKGCYAKKYNWTYPKVKISLANNFQAFKEDSESFFNQIIDFLNNGDLIFKYFRWHSSGDIVDYRYLKGMVKVAESCPATKFLCFTKKFQLVNSYLALGHKIPSNLKIVFSGWDKEFKVDNPYNLPTTIVKFRNEAKNGQIQANAIECTSDCSKCKSCWGLENGEQVFFHQH